MRAASLLGVFAIAKAAVLFGRELPLSVWTPIAYLWQDFLVVMIFGLFEMMARRHRWLDWIGWTLYALLSAYAAINVPVARVLSTPLTFPMLRAARGTLADSIFHYATGANLSLIMFVLIAAAGLPFATRRLRPRALIWGALAMLPVVLFGPEAQSRVETIGLHRNALLSLFSTALPRLRTASYRLDWRRLQQGSPSRANPPGKFEKFRGAAKDYNVMMVILESAGAQYLMPYGAAQDPMPHVTDLAQNALVVGHAYAVYPESIKGLFSVLCSAYPAMDTGPKDYEKVATPSLAAALARAGYRTALFHSGRFMYLGMRSIINNRGFEVLEDAGHIGGNHKSSFGVDEPAAVKRVLAWIEQLPKEDRFFALYLPIAGHHPYETPSKGPFAEDSELNRYLNALHYGDQALGELIEGLKRQGRFEKTLWVIFGDHGEAFEQHDGNIGHTSFIYEENIRVPLFFAAPEIFPAGRRAELVASLIDVAPTVLDLLGLSIPEAYQGSSLLSPASERMLAPFYTDYSLGLLGLRERDWKLIYNLESRRGQLFNLKLDPGEKNDVGPKYLDIVDKYRNHLLKWSESQKKEILSAGRSHDENNAQPVPGDR